MTCVHVGLVTLNLAKVESFFLCNIYTVVEFKLIDFKLIDKSVKLLIPVI